MNASTSLTLTTILIQILFGDGNPKHHGLALPILTKRQCQENVNKTFCCRFAGKPISHVRQAI